MTKSIPELRLEALQMAKEMHDLQYSESKETADIVIRLIEMNPDNRHKSPYDLKSMLDSIKPIMYSDQDVINTADRFMRFIKADGIETD